MKGYELTKPERIIADVDTLSHNYGMFIAGPLERGFGITLGNSFRRVLYSSLKGTAITSIKINTREEEKKVLHEFTIVPGVIEDVTQIILNLKEIRFRMDSDKPTILTLKADGPCEVTAADIITQNGIEIINPDQYIATVDENGSFDIEVLVSGGRGYQLVDRDIHYTTGEIPINAKFSPVTKANFRVEEARIGHMTSFDKLIIEVWTNGSIKPKEAISQAAHILTSHIKMFIDFDETYVEEVEEIDEETLKRNENLNKPVAELELSVRASNCLEAANIITIRDLVQKTDKEMLDFRNFGKKSLAEIEDILDDMGLYLGMDLDKEGLLLEEKEDEDASQKKRTSPWENQ